MNEGTQFEQKINDLERDPERALEKITEEIKVKGEKLPQRKLQAFLTVITALLTLVVSQGQGGSSKDASAAALDELNTAYANVPTFVEDTPGGLSSGSHIEESAENRIPSMEEMRDDKVRMAFAELLLGKILDLGLLGGGDDYSVEIGGYAGGELNDFNVFDENGNHVLHGNNMGSHVEGVDPPFPATLGAFEIGGERFVIQEAPDYYQ